MKKLMFLVSVCTLLTTAAYSQDDTYYTDDESTVVEKSQEAPPALLTYEQPPCPADGYLWQPGYWAWGAGGYYWVAGVWVSPPHPGLLWTPGYWGFYHGYYGWHHGYWGEHIGYYGGINYGFGYFGAGFYGGRWDGKIFRYNTAVWHVNHRVHNVYENREGIHEVVNHSSFNGPGGIRYRPTANEVQIIHENHTARTKQQVAHRQAASNDHGQFAHTNNGQPAYHSMSKPGGQRFDQHAQPVHSAPRGGGAQRGNGGAQHGNGGGRGESGS